MQNNGNRLDMPGGFKDSPANDTSATSNPDPTPIATTMRSANVINPHGSAYEVAGPSPGGTSSIHNRTLDAVKGQSLNDPAGDPSGTPAHGLVETVKENAAAAATGAAAAGASVIAAAKKLISGHDDHENELGDYSQHDSDFQPTSNINTTTGTTAINNTISPASQIVSSPRTPSVTSTPSPKPLGPHDRPPIKVAIHAHKPSDKATYGNLDSPGAQNHPGPLSDRALAGTPPPSSLSTPKKTIADPFGPVMVANWNDHKRQADVSTPTSEDFDNPHFGTPMRSSTAPSAQPAAAAAASKRMPAPSPLREEVPPVKKAAAVPTAQPPTGYFPHAQHSSTMDAATPHHPSTMTAATPQHEHKEPLTERIKEAFSHHDHPHTTATTTTAGTIAAAAAVPASHQPNVSEPSHTTTTTKPTVVKMEPLGERIKEVFHHESHPTVEVPIKVNTATIATTSAAPEVFINRTECVPVENLKDLDLTKVAQGASHMQPVQTAVTEKTTTTTTPAASKAAHERGGETLADRVKEIFHHDNSTTAKESLADRVKDVFHRDDHPDETVPHTTTSSSHRSAVPAAATAATAGTAAGVAAFLHDKESDNMTTPPHAHDHRGYLPPITKSTIPTTTTEHTPAHGEIKSHVFMPMDTSPPKKRTPVPAPVFDMTYMNTPPRTTATSSTTHSSAPVTAAHPVRPVEHTEYTISPPITATTTATKAPGVAPVAPIVPVISSTTTKPNTSEIQFTDPKTLHPVTEQRTWDIPTPTDHRSMGTKIKDAMTFHKSSEYGPADPKDLHLSDPKSLHLMDRAPIAAATAAGAAAVVAPIIHNKNTTTTTTNKDAPIVAPAVAPAIATTTTTTPSTSEIQFTDPKTLRPLTGTRTWDIPAPADHRSMGTKIKDAITLHTSSDSEYGPADPKDLHLSDPKTLHLMDRAPIAAAATAAGAAAVAAPIIHKATTTTTETKPVVVKEEKHNPVLSAPRPVIPITTTTNEPNPVLSAPHPVIPKTLSTKEEVNPVLSAPHPIIPEKKISTTHVDPTPVQTAPRPMIPASAIETHSTTGNTMSPSHPVIPVVDKHATATTTSQHSGPEKIVAPIVAAAAAAPIIQHHQQQQQQQQQQYTTPAPIVQQQQQHQMSTTTTPQNTNSYNTSSNNTPASAAPIVTQPRPSTTEVSAADKIASAIPEAYSGPLPKVQPGEEVVWVKTVTTTDFYDDNSPPAPGPPIVHNTTKNNNNNHNNGVDHVGGPGIQEVPANTMHDNHVPHRKRLSAFFDRLIHRHHDNVDKGKQRI
ncbi:hypothetical protein K457DRAFT_159089 [Linnemannia elongata AG-77]|uniref:Uncharacterized protein n=1 Tax=Linnemannia elongata AG-77 TaxID=1314771 RepID=A0A197JHJ0_9FUNG|nr:hypothetical protein K457DRAFT_159089 [Linnemannia elongata AG-77]